MQSLKAISSFALFVLLLSCSTYSESSVKSIESHWYGSGLTATGPMRSNVLPWANVFERLSKAPEVQYGFSKIKKMVACFGSRHTSE
jgi:hypothetical protein